MNPRRKPPRSEVITRADGRVYLRRWRLWRGRFFSVYLHRFMASDQAECAHDHPWPFVSLVLSGGYVEEVWPDGGSAAAEHVRRGLLSLASRDALHCHRVVACRPGRTWTLVLTGPRRRLLGSGPGRAAGCPRGSSIPRWTADGLGANQDAAEAASADGDGEEVNAMGTAIETCETALAVVLVVGFLLVVHLAVVLDMARARRRRRARRR